MGPAGDAQVGLVMRWRGEIWFVEGSGAGAWEGARERVGVGSYTYTLDDLGTWVDVAGWGSV